MGRNAELGQFVLESLLLLPLVVGGFYVAAAGALSVRDELALRDGRHRALGTVTGHKLFRSRGGGLTLGARYTFTVPGSSTIYSHADATGRHDLYAALDPVGSPTPTVGARIEIVYLPSDPWVNRPAAAGGSPLADASLGAAAGGLMGTLLLVVWIVRGRALRRFPAATVTGGSSVHR